MKKGKLTLFAIPLLALINASLLSACGPKTDYTLTIYNWEDYIYEATDEMGNIIQGEKSTVQAFKDYFEEKTGKTITIDYENFSTNEEMYQQIKLGAISPDLICPSDYMIQKMANEGMLEKFSYNEKDDKYSESLENWENYQSPFIHDRFKAEKLEDGNSFLSYAVPYFWGTMGFTYDSNWFTKEDVNSWEALWKTSADEPAGKKKFEKQFSLKDSMRDTYVAAIFHVYKDEIEALDETASDYNAKLGQIFNRCDKETIAKVEAALKGAKYAVQGFEVDEGKDDIVRGTYHANLAWSGDSVYSMDNAEQAEPAVYLNYIVPEEGSNVWFDGWCMPKGSQKELAEEFVNFISNPENAAKCMESVGYTSPVVGDEIWDLVNDWYAADEEETETYEVDLSFYFGDSIEEDALINIPLENEGRQFDAQYPTEEVLNRCCIMKDFGKAQADVEDMWLRVKAAY